MAWSSSHGKAELTRTHQEYFGDLIEIGDSDYKNQGWPPSQGLLHTQEPLVLTILKFLGSAKDVDTIGHSSALCREKPESQVDRL